MVFGDSEVLGLQGLWARPVGILGWLMGLGCKVALKIQTSQSWPGTGVEESHRDIIWAGVFLPKGDVSNCRDAVQGAKPGTPPMP